MNDFKPDVTTNDPGFSVIELIVVIGVLAILSSISIPSILGIVAQNDVEALKATLNAAAANCLQKSRLTNSAKREEIDESILSDDQLKTIGYKIDSTNNADKCSNLQIISLTGNTDNIRYPIGFSVDNEGKLTKFATPSSTDEGSIRSCKNWAGVNCRQDNSLKELIAWKSKIQEEKIKCDNTYNNYIRTKTLPYNSAKQWNTNADIGCPSRPPDDGSTSYKSLNTCTHNGCNRTVFGLDGEFVGFTKAEYDAALTAKYGRVCTEWVREKETNKYTNNPLDQPQKKTECGVNEYWFYKGKNYANQTELNKAIKQEKIDGCTTSLDNKQVESKQGAFDGKYTPLIGGPGICAESVWLCKGEKLSSDEYKESSCQPAPTPTPTPEGCTKQHPILCDIFPASSFCDCT